MKLIFISILITLNFLTTTKAFAQSCSSLANATECAYTPFCRWTNGVCLYDPNAQPVVQGSKFSSIANALDPLKGKYDNLGSIISSLLPYVLTAAGLVLFVMLIMGGFDLMFAGTDAKKAEAGKARITAAIIGFVIIFAAYWITQILEIVLGISILK